jgi:hypothetical protein
MAMSPINGSRPSDRDQPERWQPDQYAAEVPAALTLAGGGAVQRPNVGDLVGWYYGMWRVLEIRPTADVDLTDEQAKSMNYWKPEYRERHRPYAIVLCHESGPMLLERKSTKRLHDGRITAHMGVPDGGRVSWYVMGERRPLCSCCSEPWPCRELDRDLIAADQAVKAEALFETTQPGVCAACKEIVTTRQRALQFPEESLLVPGFPGPMFHAGRSACHAKAAAYERDLRLPAHPGVARLASCAGWLFSHVATSLEECTAGEMCAGVGAHGPAGGRVDGRCCTRSYSGLPDGRHPVPLTNCGFSDGDRVACLGGDPSGMVNEIAGDLYYDARNQAWGEGL